MEAENRLLSKIQYKNFETGEFTNGGERTAEEALKIIRQYPWEQQREGIVINLTNPSVTIEGRYNDFLKLALYYKGKFVLHYCDSTGELWTKAFVRLADSFPFISLFFEDRPFNTEGFRKEYTLFQNNKRHFISQEFHYEADFRRCCHYLLTSSGINLSLGLCILLWCLWVFFWGNGMPPALWAIVGGFVFFWGGGLNLLLFTDYYRHVRGKMLIMSKGNDIFYYGSKNNLKQYCKLDIMRLIHRQDSFGSRSPIASFAYIKLELKDASEIYLPNLLLSDDALARKLEDIPQVRIDKIPWLFKPDYFPKNK